MVEAVGGPVASFDVGEWTDCKDACALDRDGSVLDDSACGVAGHYVAGGPDPIGIVAGGELAKKSLRGFFCLVHYAEKNATVYCLVCVKRFLPLFFLKKFLL